MAKDKTTKPDNGKSAKSRVDDWKAYWNTLENLYGDGSDDRIKGTVKATDSKPEYEVRI